MILFVNAVDKRFLYQPLTSEIIEDPVKLTQRKPEIIYFKGKLFIVLFPLSFSPPVEQRPALVCSLLSISPVPSTAPGPQQGSRHMCGKNETVTTFTSQVPKRFVYQKDLVA